MELQSEENGEKISIRAEPTTILGRRNASSDKTISRRHLSLNLTPNSTICFEVIGKNPVLVVGSSGDKKVCRNGEKGELREGDRVCLCLERQTGFWVVTKEVEKSVLDAVRRREKRTLERRREREEREKEGAREEEEDEGVNGEFELELENLDLSSIYPIEEFGFVEMGREFDKYPKGKIKPIKNINFYLEEPKDNFDDSEGENYDYTLEASTSKSKGQRKRSKQDEDWSGESEEEKDLIAKSASGGKNPKYATRSKDDKKLRKESVKKENEDVELDETLGGFIVTDEEEERENDERESEEEEEEEEEEFEDEEDE
ncbi:hypothetical protein LUZ60_012325 [Juncus effusus]|nr:hypothetical protein LUZ60_012325 [Juncus effusus]